MSFTSKVVQDKKALIKQDGDNNKDSQKQKRDDVFKDSLPGCDYLDQISGKDFEHICYSDIYFCCELYSLRKYKNEYINDSLDACNAQIKEVLDTPAQINPIDKKDPFDYEPLCEGYDLKTEEKSFLRDINVGKDELGFGLGSLYSKTRVFLDVSDGTDLKQTDWDDKKDDPLGFYTKDKSNNNEPQVWLIMDRITEAAESLGYDRKYVIAKVYIHEMLHRFFDLRPDLGWKRSVREIEEPMAEFATLKFIEELSKHDSTFEKLLPIAKRMTEGLRKTEHFIYALGVDLYNDEAPINLIFDFQRISMLLHRSSEDSKIGNDKLDPSPMKYVEEYEEYVDKCKPDKDPNQLVEPIEKCITKYANLFPLEKGIQ